MPLSRGSWPAHAACGIGRGGPPSTARRRTGLRAARRSPGPARPGRKSTQDPRGLEPPPGTDDEVFQWLSTVLPTGSWGNVLDAGTGPTSLIWLASRPAATITAVTACDGMRETVVDEVGRFIDPSRDRLLVGNWRDEDFLRGSSYDVVLADYLLGAVEFFAPHFQLGLLRRLRDLVRAGGMLVLIGKEPNDLGAGAGDPAARLALDAEALRDAAMVCGHQRPYREMPRWWVSEQLEALGFEVMKARAFPRRLTAKKVRRNLDWAEEEMEQAFGPSARHDADSFCI